MSLDYKDDHFRRLTKPIIPCPRPREFIDLYTARGNKATIAGVEEVKQLILSDPLAGLGWYMDRMSDSRVHQAPIHAG